MNVYNFTKDFSKKETFGLTSQMQRCAVSVPSNIAEGFNRISKKEKIQFYSIALGSVSELQSQLFLARDSGYLSNDKHDSAADKTETVRKLITGMIKSIRK